MPQYSYLFTAQTAGEQRLFTVLDRIDRGIQQLVQRYHGYRQVIDQSTRTTINLRQASEQTATHQRTWFQSLIKYAGYWNTLNKAYDFAVKRLKQLGDAFTYVFRHAIQAGTGFEQAAATMQAFLGEGAAQALEATRKLGRETMYTFTQASEGAITLARAGQNATEIVANLSHVLAAASANLIGIGKAAKIGVVTANQFKISMKEALETLTAGAKQAPVTIEELGASMKTAGSIAYQLGLSLEETTGILASLSKETGITASRAGTLTKIFLERLIAQTPAASKALREMGIVLEDVRTGKFLPITVILDQFREKLAQIPSEAKKAEILKQIFGARTFAAMIPIINQGGDAIRKMVAEINNAKTVMVDLQKMRWEAMLGTIMRAKSAWEDFWITMSEILSLPIREFFTRIGNIINLVNDRIIAVRKSGGDLKAMWSDIAKAAGPELDKLTELFLQEWEKLKTLALAFWESEFLSTMVAKMAEIGSTLGKELVQGIVAGIKAVASTIGEELVSNEKLQGALWNIVGRLNPQGFAKTIMQGITGAVQIAQPTTPPVTGPPLPIPTEAVSPAERQRQQQRQEYEDYVRALREQAQEQATQMRETGAQQAVLDEQAIQKAEKLVTLKDETLQAELDLTEQQQRYRDLMQQVANSANAVKLTLIDAGKEFKKWLLEPVNIFTQMLLGIKEKFQDITGGLRERIIGIGEKYGLITGEAAGAERRKLLEQRLAATGRLAELAQTPEERQRLQERQAQFAEQLAELGGPQQQQYVKHAQTYLKNAEKYALQQEQVREKEVDIEHKAMQERIPVLEQMRRAAGGEELVRILQQLQEGYKAFGRVPEAARLQQDIARAQVEAAKEQREYWQQSLTLQQRNLEVLQEQLEELRGQTAVAERSTAVLPTEPVILGEE